MVSIILRVRKGEKMLVAGNRDLSIVTQGKDWDDLMKNIRNAVETYFDISSADVARITLDIEPGSGAIL